MGSIAEFQKKTLKLLADPNKLKSKPVIIVKDKFKVQLESKFNYEITDTSYQHIITVIHHELIIDSLLKDIINQVSLDHNP